MPETDIQWDLPDPFTLSLSPAPEDIDGLGHTNNAVYVRWCEQAGWAHSRALGLDIDDYRRLDRGMAIRRGNYHYLLPTTEGEPLLLGTWLIAGDSPLSAFRCFQLVRLSDRNTVLRGRWELVCIELSSGRPKRLPKEFKAAYQPAMTAAACPPEL
ncbi:acyl-CoA thioesterase [Paludibacterium paludis]|uniref:4-hydroxybenzoyl-CoA thioesterase n=1 Tax=Paludibacterium paludis TaxID=1225769 RepID=A0A918P248_9NEIS|nr:thioesterase family protein [Paludibacterium paludis]GGY13728.1 4-hydroxybenzoyl-CoA thioesterase [Paludibacterium paludis]